ncbi:MAG: hypothetical protein R3D63_13265 [Paracoccaceae bacterium]
MFPEGTRLDSLILMDFECKSCGLDTNPGIRLYLRDGSLRVDRAKVGIKDPFLPRLPTKMKAGLWESITWQVVLGKENAGSSKVWLNDELVIDAVGTTLLTQEVVSKLANITVKEQVDRFQVGLTANSQNKAVTVYLDDVTFCAN